MELINRLKYDIVLHYSRLKNSGVFDKYEKLKKWQWATINDAEILQYKALSDILKHSRENVPYYEEILTYLNVIDKNDYVNINEFRKIPFLDKDIIRSRFEDLKSRDNEKRKWTVNASGGSTGEPIELIQDSEMREWHSAITMLRDLWTGCQPWDPKVKLWGSERDLRVGRETFKNRLFLSLYNITTLNAFKMSDDNIGEYIDKINSIKPKQIRAYVQSIYDLARFIEKNKISIHSPKAIITTAGTLFPHMREKIETIFNATVYNVYGSRETGGLASECDQHRGLHVMTPVQFIEILNSEGEQVKPGETGEVVVTNLINYSMPLMRYKIGDMATISKERCPCGRNWPLLDTVHGRISDSFITRDGKRIHGEYFTHLFYHMNWVKKFQVIQETYDRIVIKLVTLPEDLNHEINHSKLENIEMNIKAIMGNDCNIYYKKVDNINATSSGKYRYTISHVIDDTLNV